jgi:NitT/TauT family transport system substrate-binding protein
LPSTSLTFSSAYIAQDQGFWAKEGLEVKMVNIAGVGAPNAVIAGSVDFTLTTASTFARAAARGQRMLVIANLLERPMMELVLRKDIVTGAGLDAAAPLAERAKALRGRTIGVDGVYTNLHAFLQLVARKGGLDPETDLRVAPLTAPNMPAAMAAHSIDGFSSSMPWTVGAVAAGQAVMIASSPRGDLPELLPFAYAVLMTRPELCRDHRAVCERMARGFIAAAAFIRSQPDALLPILKKHFPDIADDVMIEAIATIRSATPEKPVVTQAALENAERFSVNAGMVKPEEKLQSFDGLFTDEFVR